MFNSNSNNQSDQKKESNINNYLNFKKQPWSNEQNETIKNNNNRNDPKVKSRRTN